MLDREKRVFSVFVALALGASACQSSDPMPTVDARAEVSAEPDAPADQADAPADQADAPVDRIDALVLDAVRADAPEADRAEASLDVARSDVAPDGSGCGFGAARCGGACVSVFDNDRACGACDQACGPAQQCRNGRCDLACTADESQCPNCNDIGSDPANCGA